MGMSASSSGTSARQRRSARSKRDKTIEEMRPILEAERLARLVRPGSSASARSNWEAIKDEHLQISAEAGDDPVIRKLLEEGEQLRAERARLHEEHLALSASLEA